jgi:lipid-A-disaccharide synthase
MHGARLLEALREREPSARFVGMGGPRMAAAGLETAQDLEGMQVMGFWEVARRYGFFREVFRRLLDRLKQEHPAALVCIDYPGFNLRFAREVRKLGIPCLYYIVPQVWAWKPRRAAKMAEFIDRAYCVFEFEPPFFERYRGPGRKMKTVFVGHPLLDAPPPTRLNLPAGPPVVALLPGSRPAEFAAHWRPMCLGFHAARGVVGPLRGLMSAPRGVPVALVRRAEMGLLFGAPRGGRRMPEEGKAERNGILFGPESEHASCAEALATLDLKDEPHAACLAASSDFCVVKSGTSTLEAGLQGKPFCVVYRGGWISYALARLMVDIPVFGLVNIVLGRYVVPELLQREVNPARIAGEIERGLTDRRHIEKLREALAELPRKLGGPGASQRAAKGMLDFLAGRE